MDVSAKTEFFLRDVGELPEPPKLFTKYLR